MHESPHAWLFRHTLQQPLLAGAGPSVGISIRRTGTGVTVGAGRGVGGGFGVGGMSCVMGMSLGGWAINDAASHAPEASRYQLPSAVRAAMASDVPALALPTFG